MKLPAALALALFFVALMPNLAYSQTSDRAGVVAPAQPSVEDIKMRLETLQGIKPGEAYDGQPSFAKPFKAGSLRGGFVVQGRATLAFARFLAGLPDSVKVDPAWSFKAQHGAALLRIINKGLDHTPAMPEGIGLPKEFYQLGYSGTSSSNLDQGAANLGEAVKHFLDDSDPSNIDRLGHRRWLLAPGLDTVGFGFADKYVALRVFDPDSYGRSKNSGVSWVAWPPAGNMPLGWFGARQAWSLSLDPQAYGGSVGQAPAGVSVTLTRLRDQRVWRFGDKSAQGYFTIERSGFGLPFCLIFRPDGLDNIVDGDRFTASVRGLLDASGNEVPMDWTTGFFSTGPSIKSAAASRHPASLQLRGDWQAEDQPRQAIKFSGKQVTFGYVGVALTGFSMLLDGPDGVAPFGFKINGADKIWGPGEWIDLSDGFYSLSIVGDASLKFTIYNKEKGWSAWYESGAQASFGPDVPIEILSVIFN